MMRGSDSSQLRRLMSLLFRNFATADSRAVGLVPFDTAQRLLIEEGQTVDRKFITQLLEAFQDHSSDCILYPEMLAFLGNCSLWNVMNRLHALDLVRRKQGYNFGEFLKKYAAKRGQKIDSSRLSEQLLAIGILLPDTGTRHSTESQIIVKNSRYD